MITRIVLENFMSHVRTVIEPAEGLTVLVGPNNCGKSAVIVALQMICYNPPASLVIRHGTKEAVVTIETRDDDVVHTFVWRRRAGSASYNIDGREISRLGISGVPVDLHELLKLGKVQPPGTEPFDIHFGEQKSPMFLFDLRGSRPAKFFASSSDAEKLLAMQKKHKDNVCEAKASASRYLRDIGQLDETLQALEPTEELGALLNSARMLQASLLQDQQQAESLADYVQRRQDAQRQRDVHQSALDALQSLAPAPPLQDASALMRAIERWAEVAMRRQIADSRQQATQGLSAPPALADSAKLERAITAIEAISADQRKAAMAAEVLAPLDGVPALAPAEVFRQRLIVLYRAARERDRLGQQAAALEALAVPPTLPQVQALSQLLAQYLNAAEVAARHRAGLERINAELAQVDEDLARWVSEHPTCPTCGGAIDAADWLSHIDDQDHAVLSPEGVDA